jgi:hypothetical protein
VERDFTRLSDFIQQARQSTAKNTPPSQENEETPAPPKDDQPTQLSLF